VTTYAIGDLQGCLASFEKLAERLPDASRFIFVGDLVNRGPQSLATLRHVKALVDEGRALTLLGNHDLHLLAVAANIRPLHADDTLSDILDAPDRDDLIDWLRTRPLAHREGGCLFVHAGVLPSWDADTTLALAAEVGTRLAAGDHEAFLREMYGNEPARWSDDLTGHDRLRCVVNALTRLRLVDAAGTMLLKHKDSSSKGPPGAIPWFDHPGRATAGTPIVFGHWSTEGLVARDNVVGLDTGCVWGGRLTALRLRDRAYFQVDCPMSRSPGPD
jgi:bis(5'-nucleosyl)-tetraphosphatase (symmetrical)